MHTPARLVDPRQVQRNFARAASGYDAAAVLPREIGRRMLERPDYVRIDPQRVLDLGCGTGASLTALRQRYPQALVVGADFSEPMLRSGRSQRSRLRWLLPSLPGKRLPLVAAHAAALPLSAASFGLCWSNLMLHWTDDPLAVLREAYRVLAIEGLLMFSTFGPDTLRELRTSFKDRYDHTQQFIDLHDYGDMLLACGFSDPVMDVERLTLTYASMNDLLRDLRCSGSACAMHDRRRGLGGRQAWAEARAAYILQAREGRLPATFEVVYGHAWKAQPKQAGEARTIIRFDPKQRQR